MTWTYSVSSTHHFELLSTGHFCVLVPSTNPVMDLSIISNIEFLALYPLEKIICLNCLIWESNQGPLDPDASSLPTVPQSSYKRLVLDTLIYLVASLVPADHCGFWYLSWIYGFYEDTVHDHLVWNSTNDMDLLSKLNTSF